MEFTRLLGIIFAWIAFVLLLIFAIKPVLRKTKKCKKLRKILAKYHNQMGIACIVSVILHIVFSRSSAFTIPLGKIALVAMVVSVIAYFLRKKLKKNFIKVHGIFALLCLLFGIGHIVETNVDLWGKTDAPIVNTTTKFNGLDLIDGTYEGSSLNGYNTKVPLVVEVTIKDSSIISIVITSHGESYFPYIKNTEDQLGKYLLENQNSDVDTVSGSTYTSRAYLEAVLIAVDKAKV